MGFKGLGKERTIGREKGSEEEATCPNKVIERVKMKFLRVGYRAKPRHITSIKGEKNKTFFDGLNQFMPDIY